MLSILLVIAAGAVNSNTVEITSCAPGKQMSCVRPAQKKTAYELPLGKRCNPDSTKSLGCRERLADNREKQAHR